MALKLVDAAADAGADAVKFQKRNNRELYSAEYYESPYLSENSFGTTYGSHREFLELDIIDILRIKKHCENRGLDFISTAFDHLSLAELMSIGLDQIKIASGDLKSHYLIDMAARANVFVILSTGGATIEDVSSAAEIARLSKRGWALLQCTSSYPTSWKELNLRVIETYRANFPDAVVGFSGHDNGIAMSLVAFALGARIIEKHLTLDRTLRGTDHAFSLEPAGFKKLVRDLRRAEVALGDGVKRPYESEVEPLRKMGKMIVARRQLERGHVISWGDITFKSPGNGLTADLANQLVGRRLLRTLVKEEVVLLRDVEDPLSDDS
jgi:N-acetylneuraminate synthase/sialic acid synthase